MTDTAKGMSAFAIATTYIGTIIGAGFASGNESLQYFVSQGWWGWGAILIAVLGLHWCGKISLLVGHHLKTEDYSQAFMPSEHPFPRYYGDIIVTASLFGTFVIMVAGAGGLLKNLFGLPFVVGSILVGAAVVINLLWGIQGLVKIQELMVPVLIAGCAFIGLYFIIFPVPDAHKAAEIITSPFLVHWIPNGILYVAFNFQLAVAVLVPLGAMTQNTAELKKGMIWGSLGLLIGCGTIATSIMLNQGIVGTNPYPMVGLAEKLHPFWGYVYAAVLVFGLYSTAISCFYGAVVRLERVKAYQKLGKVGGMTALSVAGVILSFIGFSDLVGSVYPILGFGGLLVLVFMFMVAKKKLPKNAS